MSQSSATRAQALLFKFIDFIEVKLRKTEFRSINKPFYFSNEIRDADIFVGLYKGKLFQGHEEIAVDEGSFYFIPGGNNANADRVLSDAAPGGHHEMQSPSGNHSFPAGEMQEAQNKIAYVAFETVLYNSIPFFPLLNLPPFVIHPDKTLTYLLRELCIEQENNRLGRDIILRNYTVELMVMLFRIINSRPGFDQVIDKLNYLADMRIIRIVNYIRENLDKELTNASIAKVAGVSDEYVGQFFKSLTGRTLQDYIEAQRMERAMHFLKTLPNSIQEIAAMVGFRDAAYFSRRFRLHFKINATILRKENFMTPGTSEQHLPSPS